MNSKTTDRNYLISKLESLFPISLACEWDNPGNQIEKLTLLDNIVFTNATVVCLDVTSKVVDFAIENNANLIISRHPFIFNEFDTEMSNSPKRKMYDLLVKKNIQIYSIHTNYDSSDERFLVKEGLAIAFRNFKVLRANFSNDTLKVVLDNKYKMTEIIEALKKIYSNNDVQYMANTDLNEMLSEFYICTGAGADTIIDNNISNVMFITGEIKWNQWVYMNENKVDAFAFGHYMENTFVKHIANIIKTQFSNIVTLEYNINNMYKQLKG